MHLQQALALLLSPAIIEPKATLGHTPPTQNKDQASLIDRLSGAYLGLTLGGGVLGPALRPKPREVHGPGDVTLDEALVWFL